MPLAFYTLELCGSLVGFVVTDIQIFIAHNNIFIAYEYHLQTDSLVPIGICKRWTLNMQSVWLLVPSRHWHSLLCPIWDAPPFLIWSHYAASLCLLILASFPGLPCFHFPFAFTIIDRSGRQTKNREGPGTIQECTRKVHSIALLPPPPESISCSTGIIHMIMLQGLLHFSLVFHSCVLLWT